MSGYEITLSITALCPSCGKELPSNSYMTESKPTGHPLDRDNPFARKDRRVFITPCMDCFEHKAISAELLNALRAACTTIELEYGRDSCPSFRALIGRSTGEQP